MNTGDKARDTSSSVHCPLSTEEMSSPRPVGQHAQATSTTHSKPSHHDTLFHRGEMIFSIAKTPKSHRQAKKAHSACKSWRIEQLKNVAADSHTAGSHWWLGPMAARSRRAPSSGTGFVGACLGSLSATRSYSGIYFFLSIFRVVEDMMKMVILLY